MVATPRRLASNTGGNASLTYQWMFNGVPIDGATNSSHRIDCVQDGDAGGYGVIVSDGTNSLVTADRATDDRTGNRRYFLMPVTSSRQDYTFKSGVTYYIGSAIQLFGNTTIEGWNGDQARLALQRHSGSDGNFDLQGDALFSGDTDFRGR